MNENDILKVPSNAALPVDAAAMLSVNPCTAYRMMKDFEQLKKGKDENDSNHRNSSRISIQLYSDRKSFYYTNNYDIAATTTITTTTLYLTSFRSCVLAAKVFMKNRW